jgi:hypothetical protein
MPSGRPDPFSASIWMTAMKPEIGGRSREAVRR